MGQNETVDCLSIGKLVFQNFSLILYYRSIEYTIHDHELRETRKKVDEVYLDMKLPQK